MFASHVSFWLKRLVALGFFAILMTRILAANGLEPPPRGYIRTIVGNGSPGFSGDGGPAALAQVNEPEGIAIDSQGNIYIADRGNHRIRIVTPDGMIRTFAGTGVPGFTGDGGASTSAQLYGPAGVAVDSADNLYIVDAFNNRIREVTRDHVIRTVAGGGIDISGTGVATRAELEGPESIAVDRVGNFYFTDGYGYDGWGFWEPHIHKVSADGLLSIFVRPDQISGPTGLAVDSQGKLYIADGGGNCIRIVNPDGTTGIVAGNGNPGYGGDGGSATSAVLHYPSRLVVDSAGNLFIADTDNNRVRKVTPSLVISTVAGMGLSGDYGDDILATSAKLVTPVDIAVDPHGNLLIVERYGNRIRIVGGIAEGTGISADYFPQIAVGSGWSTLLVSTNLGGTEATAQLAFTDHEGSPLEVQGEVQEADGSTPLPVVDSSFTFSVPPGGTVFFSANGIEDVAQTGWARLGTLADSLTTMVTYEWNDGGQTGIRVGTVAAHLVSAATIPVDIDRSEGKQLAYAVANPSEEAIAIRLFLVGQSGGVQVDDVVISLGPRQQIARYLSEDASLEAFRGSLVLRAENGQNFVAVALSGRQGVLTSVPVISGKATVIPD